MTRKKKKLGKLYINGIDLSLQKRFQKRCIDMGIGQNEGGEKAIKQWLDKGDVNENNT